MSLDDSVPPAPARPPRGGRPDRAEPATRTEPAKSPEEVAAPGWRKTSRGLFWVLFALFWLALPGFAEFGKAVYERTAGELPKGEGWVKIDKLVNSPDEDAVQLSKREELNALIYGVPLLLGGFALLLGRLGCAAAPRYSGAGGLFLFSGLFTLLALGGLITYVVAVKMGYYELRGYAAALGMVAGGMAELWFLLGLGAVGGALKRPRVARAAGLYVFALGIGVLLVVEGGGWDAYRRYLQPKPRSADWALLEDALRMIGWLVVIGLAWRTVRAARSAARDWVDQYDEEHRGLPA